ncbi:hypothetical protein Patl1_10173 [Pistacia atlantica]|uniref:Uncharacterized protein n=1 Tax=Pistacia atlantica TaxID=434234 RepID=A0ACC1AA09_9ROSI|nr:hypothetical protein Patl1_10173 [Pistacia atlantica]
MQVEIGNYDSFYEKGIVFSPEQILNLTKETKRILPSVTLSVTVPHTLSLPDQVTNTAFASRVFESILNAPFNLMQSKLLHIQQVKLAELLEQEGVDIIQTEGGKCSSPSKSGVLGLIEKVKIRITNTVERKSLSLASPTLAAAYSISRAVRIPVMCASGISVVTAPMAITAGAAGVGVGSAINKLNDVVAMVAEVRSLADSLSMSANRIAVPEEKSFKL